MARIQRVKRIFPEIAQEQMRKFMIDRGFNYSQLGKVCSLSDSTISNLMNKKNRAYGSVTVAKVANGMGISCQQLLTGVYDPTTVVPKDAPFVNELPKIQEEKPAKTAIGKRLSAMKVLVKQGWSKEDARNAVNLEPCPLCEGVGYSECSKT